MRTGALRGPGGAASRARTLAARHPGRVVVAVAAIPRLMALFLGLSNRSALLSRDSSEYLLLADHLGSYRGSHEALWELALRRPLGYPGLLAGPRAVSEALALTAVLQAAISVGVVWLAWRLGRGLLGSAGGFVAGMWVALDPTTVVQMGRILTEGPYTAMLLLTALCARRAAVDGSVPFAGAAGLALAAATFIRPVLLYLPLVLLIVVAVAVAGRSARAGTTLRLGAAALVAFAVPVGLWIGHVRAETGVAIFSTIEGVNMLDYRAAGAKASDEGTSRAAAAIELRSELARRDPGPADAARQAQEARSLGLEVLADHPVGYARSATEGLAKLLLGPGRAPVDALTQDLPGGGLLAALVVVAAVASAALLLVAAGAGTIRSIRQHQHLTLALTALPIVYHLVLTSGADSDSRFRAPLVPFLAILAASWITPRLASSVRAAHTY